MQLQRNANQGNTNFEYAIEMTETPFPVDFHYTIYINVYAYIIKRYCDSRL